MSNSISGSTPIIMPHPEEWEKVAKTNELKTFGYEGGPNIDIEWFYKPEEVRKTQDGNVAIIRKPVLGEFGDGPTDLLSPLRVLFGFPGEYFGVQAAENAWVADLYESAVLRGNIERFINTREKNAIPFLTYKAFGGSQSKKNEQPKETINELYNVVENLYKKYGELEENIYLLNLASYTQQPYKNNRR
ncbi:MAG: hypothetical protein B6U88_02110 [Candidatus Aenigmarchaeota archaeon ex4484_56]|nr:MAG: hypothetical protein B6U88_02110 [Candidatus Aenigmarchaeota archaeon ex4484_56]